jgi:hypothetical protein
MPKKMIEIRLCLATQNYPDSKNADFKHGKYTDFLMDFSAWVNENSGGHQAWGYFGRYFFSLGEKAVLFL